jgi:hypothetical protein
MPINIVKVKKNSISEESVITESIPTDSSITESSLDKDQKKTKTQSRKKGTKSVKLSPIEEEILAIQQEISLNQEIASETEAKDSGKKTKTQTEKKGTKSAELAPITEEIESIQEEVNLTQEIPSEIETKDLGKKTQAKKKESKSVELVSIAEKVEEIEIIQEISPETVIPETVPVIESQPAQAKKKKTKKAKVSPENPVPENSVPENPSENSPETPKTEEPEQKSPIFQAFGLVKGKILEQGSSYVLQIEDKTYPLFGSRGRIKSFVGSEEEVYLRVYPNWQPNTQKEAFLRNLSFTAVAILEKCPKNYPVNHFKVRGIWQRVPFLDEPVITVYRNQSRGAHDDCKALHFPLVWKDAPVEAFEYDSSLKGKQDYSKRFFCQVKVIFSPETEQFTVIGLLEEPTTDIPPYIKPKKSPKPPKVEKSSQPKPPIILKKKAEEIPETDLSSTLDFTPSKSSTLNVTPSKGSIG